MRHAIAQLASLTVLGLLGCATPAQVSQVRFHNRPPVQAVNDRLPVEDAPESLPYYQFHYQLRTFFTDRGRMLLSAKPFRRALGVNSLGEVPDSTWFTNRDIEALTPDDIRRGPNRAPDPSQHLPWTIVSTKSEGVAAGFVIEDARGQRHLLKFDQKGFPETESATHMICHRIMWALGYNVPEDRVAWIRLEDLRITDESVKTEPDGDKEPLTRAEFEKVMARADKQEDGRYRVLLSQFVPGKPLGGASMLGTRDGDPNDVIPHERRRDQRALLAIFAWLKHTDLKESNTLDAWIEDPDQPGRKIVLHYQIDFGKAMGVLGLIGGARDDGFTYVLDLGQSMRSLFTLGFWKTPWDDVDATGLRGVGLYSAEEYDPRDYTPRLPYFPISDADRFDAFWGAKLLMRLSREQLRAAVEAGELSQPEAASYVEDVLVKRQRMTARHWFQRVAPLDAFRVEGADGRARLCFRDLSVHYQLWDGPRRYRIGAYDAAGESFSPPVELAGTGADLCQDVEGSDSSDGYTIVRIDTHSGQRWLPPLEVHLARGGAQGGLRVIGLHRR